VPFGECHGGCGNPAGLAPETSKRRGWILHYPKLYCDDPDCWKPAARARAQAARWHQIVELQEELEREKERTGELDPGEVAERIDRSRVTITAAAKRHGIGRRFGKLGNGGTYLFTENDVEKLRQLVPGRTGRPPFRSTNGEISLTQAAEFLGVSTQVVSGEYVPKGQLVPIRREGIGRGVLVFSERDVKRFAKERLSSPDRRVQLRFDPVYVEGHALRSGLSRREARQRGAAAVERQQRLNRIRVGTGRPASATDDHAAWATRFEQLRAEEDERYEVDCANGYNDRPLSDWEITRLVADEFDKTPDAVWKAVKRLQTTTDKTRSR
jgi:hypothetical protein